MSKIIFIYLSTIFLFKNIILLLSAREFHITYPNITDFLVLSYPPSSTCNLLPKRKFKIFKLKNYISPIFSITHRRLSDKALLSHLQSRHTYTLSVYVEKNDISNLRQSNNFIRYFLHLHFKCYPESPL
jgi:hypothetical protein